MNPVFKNQNTIEVLSQKRVNITSFKILHMIGLGGFSKVVLGKFILIEARHLVTGKFHALKVICKQFILQNKKEDIIMNEKEIMINVKHPHIVKLDYIF